MTSLPLVLRSPSEMRAWRHSAQGQVGFVPTMGALHEGHANLIRRLRARCDRLVLSIFVNPSQFGPKEDLSKYPRTFEADMEIARVEGVDAVFFPTPEQVYPPGYSTYVEEGTLTGPLCGEFRPGHFRGVTTVVLKLFNLVAPHTAYFGLKDAQQFFVLHKMGRDLDLDISIEGVATVREPDGLALSSRNRYLSATERQIAPRVYAALQNVAHQLKSREVSEPTLQRARADLDNAGLKVQYLDCVRLPDFSRTALAASAPGAPLDAQSPYLIAVAAFLGTTRLIDNIILRPERLAELGIRTHL